MDRDLALHAASLLTRPAEEFDNDPNIEMQWVMKATEHMEVYYNLIRSVKGSVLRLTPHDDKIYEHFRTCFPSLNIALLTENDLKNDEAKAKWREFCMEYKDIVQDYNFGTLLRLDCSKEYCEDNTTFVPRVQFYAIEIARNREGLNDVVYNNCAAKNKLADK